MLRDREHSRRRVSVIEFPAVFKSIVFAGEQRSRPERRDDVASLSARTKESSTEDWIRNRYVEKTSKRVARSTPSPNSRLPESFSINPGEPTSLQERERERDWSSLESSPPDWTLARGNEKKYQDFNSWSHSGGEKEKKYLSRHLRYLKV